MKTHHAESIFNKMLDDINELKITTYKKFSSK